MLKRKKPWIRKPWKKSLPKKKNTPSYQNKESKIEEWGRIRAELKERFVAVGILSCELKLEGCTRAANFGWSWSFAHSEKRDNIASRKTNPELREIQIREVVYSCGNCHDFIERRGNKPREDALPLMRDYVLAAINSRKIQP